MHTLKNLNISHKIKLTLAVFSLTISGLTLDVKKSYSTVVSHDPLSYAQMLIDSDTMVNQLGKLTAQIALIESQLEQAKAMANSLADGNITAEMVEFVFEQAERCGFTPTTLPYVKFNGLNIKVCDGDNSYDVIKDKVSKIFTYEDGISEEEAIKRGKNARIRQTEAIAHALTKTVENNNLNVTPKTKAWTEQMKQSQSLAHQMYMNNSILISIYNEQVETRKLISNLLEILALERTKPLQSYNQNKGQ